MSTTIMAAVAIVAIVFLLSAYDQNSDNNIIPTIALAQSATDDKGVIMYYYPSLQRSVYNPLILASGGISYFTEYQDTGDSQSKQYFINTANWLLNNAIDKEQGRYSIWEYTFTWPWYGSIGWP